MRNLNIPRGLPQMHGGQGGGHQINQNNAALVSGSDPSQYMTSALKSTL